MPLAEWSSLFKRDQWGWKGASTDCNARNEPCTAPLACIRNNPNKTKPTSTRNTRDRCEESQEYPVGNNKNPSQKQSGEKEPGTLHYNPGNMSGKTAGTKKDEPQSAADKNPGDPDPQDK